MEKSTQIEAKDSKNELQISNSYYYDRKGNITSANSLHGKIVKEPIMPLINQ